jgi:hypothetical protein
MAYLFCVGVYSNSFSMLATQMNHLIHEKKLEPFTIIKMKKHICNSVKYHKHSFYYLAVKAFQPKLNVRLFYTDAHYYMGTYFLGVGLCLCSSTVLLGYADYSEIIHLEVSFVR